MSSTLSIQRWTFFIPPIFTSIEQLNLSLAHCFAEHNLPYTQSRLSPVLNRLCRRCCHLPNGGFFWTYSPENSREKYIPPCPLDFWSPHKPLYHLCSSLSFAWYTAELKSAWYADTAFSKIIRIVQPACQSPMLRLRQSTYILLLSVEARCFLTAERVPVCSPAVFFYVR